MSRARLTMACWDYDRTRALIDGRIKPEGIDLDVSIMRPRLAFERMLARGDFDVCEMSMSNYVTLRALPGCPLVALPVMLSKMFRHDCIYVHQDSGISAPSDLAGKRVGTMRYTSTALVFVRGLLQHDYGLSPRDVHWFIGGINQGLDATSPDGLAAEIQVSLLGSHQTLDDLLGRREVDALITQDIPASFLRRENHIRRLFADFKSAEIDYYRRTRIFPFMHTVVIKSVLHNQNPALARSIYHAFWMPKS